MNNIDYDQLLDDIDTLEKELSEMHNAPDSSMSSTVLLSEAEEVRDMFRLHLNNKKKTNDKILLDDETIDNLVSFNEEALKSLKTFKEISELNKVSETDECYKELDEVHKYVMKNKEMINAEMIKLEAVCNNMESLTDAINKT